MSPTMNLSFSSVLAVDILTAVTTHLWFRHYEPSSVAAVVILLLALPLPSAYLLLDHVTSTLRAICIAHLTFLTAITTSIVCYRLSPIHPLAQYPGPILCKLSKLYGVAIAFKGNTHLYHKQLHDQYGSIVRIGPNELSIVEKAMIPSILGGQGMPKGPLWDGRRFGLSDKGLKYDTLIDVRDLAIHARDRKPWNKAFSGPSLKDYEELLMPRVIQLGNELEKLCKGEGGKADVVDMADWMSRFAFDFMGDIAFGGCFELMRDGDAFNFIEGMVTGLFFSSIVQHIPWMIHFLRGLPFAVKRSADFAAFGIANAKKRASLEMDKRTSLLTWYLEASGLESSAESSLSTIVANSLLVIVAGSDTTASVLSNIIYYLVSNPDDYDRLRTEIDNAFPSTLRLNSLDVEKLSSLSFLSAVINEALRLLPPVPTSLQRAPAKNSGGKVVGHLFIPEGTAVQVPPYVIHRDPRYFSPHPEKFWPERWVPSDKNTVTLDRAAFIPFSHGPASCVGRPLAMTELRAVTAMLIKRFDMAFAEGYDTRLWVDGLKDRFVFEKGKLPIKLHLRRPGH